MKKIAAVHNISEGSAQAFFDPLEQQLIEAFTQGVSQTFEIQCFLETRGLTPYTKSPKNRLQYDIAASMGLLGKTLNGTVALGFSEKTFLGVLSKMLGEEYREITTEVEDGCGELLNIIFGQAKRRLAEKGYSLGRTLPSIFIGQALRVKQLTPSPTLILPFECGAGPFHLEIGYRKNQNPVRKA